VVVAVTLAAMLAAGFLLAPVIDEGPTLCPTRLAFGIPCPSCGITRACCAATRGHFVDSISYHLFGPLVVAGALVLVPALIVEAARRRRIAVLSRVLYSMKLGWSFAAVLIAYHVVRLVHLGVSGELGQAMKLSLVSSLVHRVASFFA